jgi:hypothetical protein
MARLRATALAARSVLDGREHDGMLGRVGATDSHQPNNQKARTQHRSRPRSCSRAERNSVTQILIADILDSFLAHLLPNADQHCLIVRFDPLSPSQSQVRLEFAIEDGMDNVESNLGGHDSHRGRSIDTSIIARA